MYKISMVFGRETIYMCIMNSLIIIIRLTSRNFCKDIKGGESYKIHEQDL